MSTRQVSMQIAADARRFNAAMQRIAAAMLRGYADSAEKVSPPPKEHTMPDPTPLDLPALITAVREAEMEEARASAGLNALYDTSIGVLRALDDAAGALIASRYADDADVAHARGLVEGAAHALRGTLGVAPEGS